ncbi:ATP-binding protein [Pseudactinotalea sp. HY158]|uniref:ATP-binding protein n=1 Tax=unclassified Pseudactinotalea TaxID=2649176 RepID=UPI003519DE99
MTVAVLLLGVPMAVAGAVLVRQGVVSNLSLRTQSIARAVDTRLGMNLEIDSDFLQRWVADESDPAINIVVTTPHGVVEAGVAVPDDPRQVFLVRQTLSVAGSEVRVSIPSSILFWRGAEVVGVVILLSIVAFGVAAAVASRQARRLAAPLIYLAASAEQLGAGQVRPQLRESGVEEIDLVTAELVRSGERMAARLAAEREFAANASHQLRTPLTALSMRLEEIQLVTEDPHIAEEARISLDQIERLVGVVDDLLKYSRNADGGTTEAVDLDEIFSQQRAEWAPSYERAGRELVFSPPTGATALATPGALSQALATLLENSLKYGDGRTTVSVRDSRSETAADSGTVIEVADEGEGISDDLAPRIFERHVTSGGGTGLGLGLARDLVVADGGRIDLAQRRPPIFAIFLSAVPERLNPDAVLPPGSVVVMGRRRRRQ